MATTPTFRASGLASGIDSQSLINELVKIESRTVDLARGKQEAFKSQLSAIGDVISKLTSMKTATAALSTSGVLGVVQSGTSQGFTAQPSPTSATGRYSVQVDGLAQAARARSQAFTSASALVTGGTLDLTIDGATTSITLDDGMTLTEAANRISRSGAAVTANVLETNGQAFLSITRRDTGFVVGQPAASALQISETSTGALGQALSAATVASATNAQLRVDGLAFERRTNVVADVIPGTTLSLTKQTTAPEDLVLSTSTSDTQKALQKFVDAYNDAMKLVRKHTNIGELTDRAKTLGGDESIRSLQSALQSLVTQQANPSSPIRTLADIGIKTGSDGTLSIDSSRLEKAISSDAAAVNALFQQAGTGMSAATSALVDRFTTGSNSILVARKTGIDRSIRAMDDRIKQLELRVDSYRERLVRQFTAMEKLVGGFKSIGNFLTSQEKRGQQE